MVVPAVEKAGHAWKIPVDNPKNSNKPFMGIAVTVHNSEILFAEYEEASSTRLGQAHFYSPRGGRTIGNDKFFLLQEDFMALKRVPFKELSKYVVGGKPQTVDGCTAVLFQVKDNGYMPVLDKPGDRTQATTPKFVGTYFVKSDTMSYWTSKGVVTISHMRDFVNQASKADRVEFLCRTSHDYPK